MGIPGVDSPTPRAWYAFPGTPGNNRPGNFAQFLTSGTIVVPNYAGVSGFLGLVGPTFGQDIQLSSSTSSGTVGNVVVSGLVNTAAPAQSYYVQLAYSGPGTNLSVPGAEFICNCAAGIVPAIEVSTAGPYSIAASKFAPYIGVYSGGEWLQASSLTATATGTFFSTPWPLTNMQGVQEAPSSVSANIVGIASHDSAATWSDGPGGSFNGGSMNNRLGYWPNPSPLGLPDPQQLLIIQLQTGQPFEISLKQSWTEGLAGAAIGITLDAASGWHVADITAAAIGNVFSRVDVGGNEGDIGARVKCILTADVI